MEVFTISIQDKRPPVWVGHVTLPTPDVPATRDFMIQLGMRHIADSGKFSILELRGGTHLVLKPAEAHVSGLAEFDLMVDDIDATHNRFQGLGLSPSEIQPGRIHRSFTLNSPSGHTIKFNSSHVSGQPI